MRKDISTENALKAYRNSQGMLKWYREQAFIESQKRELRRLCLFTGIFVVTELICVVYALYFNH